MCIMMKLHSLTFQWLNMNIVADTIFLNEPNDRDIIRIPYLFGYYIVSLSSFPRSVLVVVHHNCCFF